MGQVTRMKSNKTNERKKENHMIQGSIRKKKTRSLASFRGKSITLGSGVHELTLAVWLSVCVYKNIYIQHMNSFLTTRAIYMYIYL